MSVNIQRSPEKLVTRPIPQDLTLVVFLLKGLLVESRPFQQPRLFIREDGIAKILIVQLSHSNNPTVGSAIEITLFISLCSTYVQMERFSIFTEYVQPRI